MIEVPVLIVGGGPVGLTASLLLSRLGIRTLLVERHPGTAIHPKARGINARTMEIFHQQGIDSLLPAKPVIHLEFNPNNQSHWFTSVMLIITNITVLAIILVGAAVIREREHGTIEHLLEIGRAHV